MYGRTLFEERHYFCCRCGEELGEDDGQVIDDEIYCDWCAENLFDEEEEDEEGDEE